MSISRKEAIEFVRDKLGIVDVENRPLDLRLLNRIMRCLLSEVPFQNVLLYKTPPERRFPTADDVVRLGLSLIGGICIHDNWFASLLLRAIGFDLFTIAGRVTASPQSTYDHPMTIVRGLKDPDDPNRDDALFLVDVGMGYPTPGAVPIHDLPFEFPITAGFELRYTKVGDLYYRWHRHGYSANDQTSLKLNDGWTPKLSFTLDPRDPATLEASMENVFKTEPPSEFMRMMRIFRWPKDHDDSVVAIRGQELLLFGTAKQFGTENNLKKQKMKIELDDLEDTILKYFPSIDPTELREALPCAIQTSKISI